MHPDLAKQPESKTFSILLSDLELYGSTELFLLRKDKLLNLNAAPLPKPSKVSGLKKRTLRKPVTRKHSTFPDMISAVLKNKNRTPA